MKFKGNRRQFKALVAGAVAMRSTARWDLWRHPWRLLHFLHRRYPSGVAVADVADSLDVALRRETVLVLVQPFVTSDGVRHAFALCYRARNSRGLQ